MKVSRLFGYRRKRNSVNINKKESGIILLPCYFTPIILEYQRDTHKNRYAVSTSNDF